MSSWTSYHKIFNLGHRAVLEIFDGPVVVEEKVDGSQFSFGRFGDELKVRSKGVEIDPDNLADGMFSKAVATAKELFPILHDGWTYRAEYLQKPDHNTLSYGRIPNKHLIIFDIAVGEENYLDRAAKEAEAARIGLEVVPLLTAGSVDTLADFQKFLDLPSILGGQKIEGVVVKNHAKFGEDKKPLLAKYVAPDFKEANQANWGAVKKEMKHDDVIALIASRYATAARWKKAIQHLKERGLLDNSPKDIGPLLKEVNVDFKAECFNEVAEELWKWAERRLYQGITRGFPEWYKAWLLEKQFATQTEEQKCSNG